MPQHASQILDSLNAAIIQLSPDYHVRYVNNTAEAMLEASAGSLIGKSFDSLLSRVEPSTIAEKITEDIEDSSGLTEREAVITFATGKSISADYSIYPFSDDQNNRSILIEIRQLEGQVQFARQEQGQLQKLAAQQLARGLAHEIKNPLSGIRGAAQLLEKELGNAEWMEYTEIIISEVDRLHALIDSMLGPGKLQQFESVNILEVLEHIRKIILAAEPSRITIRRDYDPSIPEIQADRNLLIQAFLNIVQNAVQAIAETGDITFKTRIGRRFTIGQVTHPLVVQIDIIDSGCGISKELGNSIFLPMVTDKARGSGLGLPITQEIISRHGGTLRISSDDSGTIISTILPLTIK